MLMNRLFFDLIKVSIGKAGCLSHSPSADEWSELYAMAKKQSLVGVCFAGLQRFVGQQQEPPEMLYLTWMGMAAKIQQRNEVVNRQCVDLQKRLSADGFRSCILKGQGNAALYKVSKASNEFHVSSGLSLLRQSGDIDCWVEGGFEKVNAWAQKIATSKEINQHHIHFDIYDDTEVELHYYPFNLTSPFKNKTLGKFFKEQEESCFTNECSLGFCVPSSEFNLVFLMVHIFHHLFTEGVGLRLVMDYYFVVKHEMEVKNGSNVKKVREVIESLGLNKFASALMWMLGEVFGLEREQMLWEPDKEDGAFLLEEIMLSGNFGKQDARQKRLYDSKWNSFWLVHGKTFRFWRFDHWAWFWSPIHRVRSKIWQLKRGYK